MTSSCADCSSPLLGNHRVLLVCEDPTVYCDAEKRESIKQTCIPATLQKLDEASDAGSRKGLQSDFQTVLNTVNLYVGVGLLSLGYAIKLGGWLSLVFLGVLALLLCYSAKLLCWSFERLPPQIVPSYPNLGAQAYGPLGRWAVIMMGVAEFFGACCLCLIVVWQSVAILLPTSHICVHSSCFSNRAMAIVGSTLLTFPAIWIRTFSRLTSISVSGILSSLLLTSVVVFAYIVDPHSDKVLDAASKIHDTVDWSHLPIAMGIFVVSLSGHTGLPSIRRSMLNPQHFEHCVNWAFLAMFLLYATMGGFAYLYFGEATEVLVTTNLNKSSSITGLVFLGIGRFSLSINQAVTVLVALSAYSTVPALVYVIAELLIDIAWGSLHAHVSGITELMTRTAILGLAYLVAIIAYDVLDSVESIVGGACSVSVSLLLPAIIYYRLYERELNFWRKHAVFSLSIFGVVCAVGIASINILKLCNIIRV